MTRPRSAEIRTLLDEDLAELFDQAPIGFVSTLADGTIVRVNATFGRWTGFAANELTGRRFQELFSTPGRIYYETHLAPLLAMQGSLNEIALDIKCSNGELLPALVNAAQRRGPTPDALLNRFTVFNATDRRRYEQQLLQARRHAEAAVQAKNELLGMLSHDIRTPLGAIISVAALLERVSGDSAQRDSVRILKSSASTMLRLVDEILEHSRLEAGAVALQERPFDPRAFVAELVANLHPLAKDKGIQLHANVDTDVPAMLEGDDVKLGRVVSNLLGNAIKFTEKGAVRLELACLQAGAAGVRLRVSVSDTGIGIAEEDLPRIFEAYGQANAAIARRYGGSGLGLAIGRKLLDAMGSRLEVKSAAGEGSIFWFDLTLRMPRID